MPVWSHLLSPRRARRVGLAAVVALAGCLGQAPHDNPLDPESASYRDAGAVAGVVTGIYPPFAGRAGARVHLIPLSGAGEERVVRTAADGTYRVDALPAGRYGVRAEGDGLQGAADTVTVTVGAVAEARFALDALPIVTVPVVRTVHIENWPPLSPVFQVEVSAEATDPDRVADVDSVFLVADGLPVRLPLAETTPGHFTATVDAALLPDGRVQSLLGRTLTIQATDRSGGTGVSAPFSLVRVVEQTPLTFRPQVPGEAIETNPPTLEWRPSDLPFAFTYRVELFVQDGAGVPTRVFTQSGLPSTQTALTLPSALAAGSYSWTVWTVDEAGNGSRSRPAGFTAP